MSKKETGKEVMAMVQSDLPDYLKNQAGQGRGSENVGAEDLVIPRVEVTQSLSPARNKKDPNYIEGCEEGDIYNNVTRELYGKDVMVIPVFFRKEFLIWKDRQKGGGFRGSFLSEVEAEDRLAEVAAEEGNDFDIVETAQHFVLVLHDNKIQEAVISMSKSKLKVSRNWNSLIRMNGGDSFSRVYKLASISDTNAQNQEYYNFKISALGFPTEEVYKAAEKLYNVIKSGQFSVDAKFDEAADVVSESTEY